MSSAGWSATAPEGVVAHSGVVGNNPSSSVSAGAQVSLGTSTPMPSHTGVSLSTISSINPHLSCVAEEEEEDDSVLEVTQDVSSINLGGANDVHASNELVFSDEPQAPDAFTGINSSVLWTAADRLVNLNPLSKSYKKNFDLVTTGISSKLGVPTLLASAKDEEDDIRPSEHISDVYAGNVTKLEQIEEHLTRYSLRSIFWLPTILQMILTLAPTLVFDMSKKRDLFSKWNTIPFVEVCFIQRFINSSRHVLPAARQASLIGLEYLKQCVTAGLHERIGEKYKPLDDAEKGALTYWWILAGIVFHINRHTEGALQRFLTNFKKLGPGLWKENITICVKQLRSAVKILHQHDKLRDESVKDLLIGFTKSKIADIASHAKHHLIRFNDQIIDDECGRNLFCKHSGCDPFLAKKGKCSIH